jgi:hypothetical protein
MGTKVIGIGSIVAFADAPKEFDGIEAKSLLTFDVNFYESDAEWSQSHSASDAVEEAVRF